MSEREALLAQLRDPSSPLVSLWPLAPAWWVLLALAAASLIALLVSLRSRQRKRRLAWLRAARHALTVIRTDIGAVPSRDLLARASTLVRQIALGVYRREAVASLHGSQWLQQLDTLSQSRDFSAGAGRCLADVPYRGDANMTADELVELCEAIDHLIVQTERYVKASAKSDMAEKTAARIPDTGTSVPTDPARTS